MAKTPKGQHRMRSKDVFKRSSIGLDPERPPNSKVIRIDGEVYEHLKGFAVPLRDTPNMVIRRIMGLDPELSPEDYAKTANGQQL